MNITPNLHEDERRKLIEWIPDFPMRTSKVLIAKEDCELGNHYHNEKDSLFYLLQGEGEYNTGFEWLPIEGTVFVPKGVPHTFKVKKGSIMLEAASTPYDPDDEIPA